MEILLSNYFHSMTIPILTIYKENNYYCLIWVTEGNGKLEELIFQNTILSRILCFRFTPYQPFMFSTTLIKGVAIYFHSDFFCIHKHQKEATCNGILFNNIYQMPFILVDGILGSTFFT